MMQNTVEGLKQLPGSIHVEAEFLLTDSRRMQRTNLRAAAKNYQQRANRMANQQMLKDLMQDATESMTGQKIEILLRKPVRQGFDGYVYLTTTGDAKMDICPDLPIEKMYRVWLHEVGHIVSGHLQQPDYEPFDYHLFPSSLVDNKMTEQEATEYQESPSEVEAESFANEMDHFVTRKAFDLFSNTSIETRIRVLTMTQIQ